ncbi:MAG: peptidylprolyl isomerase [Burkholderiales bacterium]|nr:peptidylprolyl isomerase [Burkholderiales bacterium]
MARALSFPFLALAMAASMALCAPAYAAPFARVGDVVITQEEFDSAFAQAARGKFYHGKPPENAVAALQREVAQGMVDEVLVAREAERRGLKPDAAAVQQTIAGYEQRYRASEQWKANREKLLPGIVAKLERDSLTEQLMKQAKQVADPTPAELQQYYLSQKDKFTSPEQVRVRMILLKVDPSSPQAKWDATRDEGAAIHRKLKSGADFAQLAELHSNDASAARGGDLGYVHHGMLPDAAQQAVDKLKAGELSEPVFLLEGVAVFRLEHRREPVLNPLDAVRERARGLYLRDKGEQAWTALLEQLRRATPASIDESRFLPLATAAKPGDGPAPR